MAGRSVVSIATSLTVMGLAAALLFKSFGHFGFDWAAQGRNEMDPALAERHVDDLGLRGQARRRLAPDDRFDVDPRSAVESVLMAEPTNGVYWLGLAEILQDDGDPFDQVRRALQMSLIAEPLEASTIVRRAVFLFSLWETLTETDRALTISEFAKLGARFPLDARAQIRTILANKSDQTRAEIRQALIDKIRADPGLLATLGL